MRLIFVYYRVSVQEAGLNAPIHSLIDLNLKSAYVLVRNVDLKQSDGHALYVVFDSQTHNRISEASVTQNLFRNIRFQGVLHMENKGVNDAVFWVDSNVIMHNMASESWNTIQIVNSTLYMRNNLIYNNSAAHILQFGNAKNVTKLLQTCEGNTFWLNVPHTNVNRQTIILMAEKVEFHNNVINNPVAKAELATSGVITGNYSLNCTYNWWGSGLLNAAVSKILDGSRVDGFADVEIDPILQSPNPSFSLSSKFI